MNDSIYSMYLCDNENARRHSSTARTYEADGEPPWWVAAIVIASPIVIAILTEIFSK